MKFLIRILICTTLAALAWTAPLRAAEPTLEATSAADSVAVEPAASDDFDVNALIDEHLSDAYVWHITTVGGHPVEIFLPVIVRSQDTGWHVFSSRRIAEGETYEGFSIAAADSPYAGKVVAIDATGAQYRPWDISITKNVLALLINCAILLAIFLSVARWYGRKPKNAVPRGFVGAMEMFVMNIEEEVIRPSVGKDFRRYSPYLLTVFFFVLINNLMGLIPFFPGGANTTGNIAITLVLALCTMVAVNVFANKGYWKEIFWPDVPWWLKVPIPLMPVIELFGVFSKPFALMIRLLANIMAGHTIILSLTCMVFIAAKMSVGMTAGMTAFSVLLSIFMSLLEVLVAYIQAYVFTLLSAVFIGLAHPEHEHVKAKN